jgi:hypothetical protein
MADDYMTGAAEYGALHVHLLRAGWRMPNLGEYDCGTLPVYDVILSDGSLRTATCSFKRGWYLKGETGDPFHSIRMGRDMPDVDVILCRAQPENPDGSD